MEKYKFNQNSLLVCCNGMFSVLFNIVLDIK